MTPDEMLQEIARLKDELSRLKQSSPSVNTRVLYQGGEWIVTGIAGSRVIIQNDSEILNVSREEIEVIE